MLFFLNNVWKLVFLFKECSYRNAKFSRNLWATTRKQQGDYNNFLRTIQKMKNEVKNIKFGSFMQTSILKYFFSSRILGNIFGNFMKLLICTTVGTEILHWVSKRNY